MIIKKGDILHSGANIIINPVDCVGGFCSSTNGLIGEELPWVESEYRRFIRKHNNLLGSVQFVPNEVWAVGLTNTMEINNQISLYNDFSYIANIFTTYDNDNYYDVEATLSCLNIIKQRMCENAIKTIAIPFDFIEHTSEEFCEDLYLCFESMSIDLIFYQSE